MFAHQKRIFGLSAGLLTLLTVFFGNCAAAILHNEDCIACHGQAGTHTGKRKGVFIDPVRFKSSVHWQRGVGCVSCHEGSFDEGTVAKGSHPKSVEVKCQECHERVYNEYQKSLHYHVSRKICYSCHNPHYTVSFRDMSQDSRKGICLKCHNSNQTHKWLPQKELHFNYLECTSCHSLDAQIGMAFFMVNKAATNKEYVLTHQQLEPFIDAARSLVQTLDADDNGSLSNDEIQIFIEKIRRGGIPEAGLEVRILVLTPNHNYSSKNERTQDCTLCHSRDAKFYSKILLEVPEPDGGFITIPINRQILSSLWKLPLSEDFFLLGESKIHREDIRVLWDVINKIGFRWLDLMGATIILSAILAVSFHGMLMFLTRKSRDGSKDFDYKGRLPLPVLCWHWVHGLCITLLIATGIQLRLPDSVPIFAKFLNAVNLHNLVGTMLILDYAFWVLFHLAKREFKPRFFISPRDFFLHMTDMLHYYGYLIFVGERFPDRCRFYSPFDPLERAFFLTTMFLLIPLQAFTGILLLYLNQLGPVIKIMGGLRVVDAIHIICGYFLVASLIIHVYFHTLKKYSSQSTRSS